MIIPLLSKANRGFRAVSSMITDTYLSIGDSFSDSVFRDLKRSSVKPWGARTKVNGDKTLSGGRINWSHSRSDWKKNQSYIRDHPYITSAHFWTFSDPSTYPTSAKIAIFLTPPTQSLCWRSVGMVPKLNWKKNHIQWTVNDASEWSLGKKPTGLYSVWGGFPGEIQ